MKTLREFITEAPNDVPEFISNGVRELKQQLIDTLGDGFVVKVGISMLGRPSIVVTVYGSNPTNGIPQNSPTWMNMWMHGPKEDAPVSWESNTVPRSLSFRKITAKSVSEANAKLVAWFKKTKDTMVGLENGTIERYAR